LIASAEAAWAEKARKTQVQGGLELTSKGRRYSLWEKARGPMWFWAMRTTKGNHRRLRTSEEHKGHPPWRQEEFGGPACPSITKHRADAPDNGGQNSADTDLGTPHATKGGV